MCNHTKIEMELEVENINVSIGDKLKQLREARGLSVTALAKSLSTEKKFYSYNSIHRYETGSAIFTIEFLLDLCSFFNVGLNYFLVDQAKISLSSDGCSDIILSLNKKNRNKLLKLFSNIQEMSDDNIFNIILNLIERVISIKKPK